MERLQILLFGRFDRNEAHRRAQSCFINSLCIRRIVLGSLDERLHKTRIDQQNPMAISKKAPTPIVRAGAGLHRNGLRSQFLDRLEQFGSTRLARNDHAIAIDAMAVKRAFSKINSK